MGFSHNVGIVMPVFLKIALLNCACVYIPIYKMSRFRFSARCLVGVGIRWCGEMFVVRSVAYLSKKKGGEKTIMGCFHVLHNCRSECKRAKHGRLLQCDRSGNHRRLLIFVGATATAVR